MTEKTRTQTDSSRHERAQVKLPVPNEVLERVARQHGSPTYVYSEETLRDQCRSLKDAFSGLPVHIAYAMKANANPGVLQIIQSEGLGLDVVSPGELHLALALGFDPDDILYSANNMTDSEMHHARQSDVLLNVGERSRLRKLGEAYPGSEVCLRINPQVGGGHHRHVVTAGPKSKFGIPVDDLAQALHLADEHELHVVGLHQHVGSGITDASLLQEAISVCLDAAAQVPSLRFVNFGGGFGIPYTLEDEALDLSALRKKIEEPLLNFAEKHGVESFSFEPGRYLVAQSGVLLMRVNTLKETQTRTFAGCNSGMGHFMRPAVYGAKHLVWNVSNPGGPLKRYYVAGNICEAGDLFAKQQRIPEIREGDVLAVLDAGAYGMSMASTYNLRPLPAEVLVDDDHTIRVTQERETSEQLATRILEKSTIAASN